MTSDLFFLINHLFQKKLFVNEAGKTEINNLPEIAQSINIWETVLSMVILGPPRTNCHIVICCSFLPVCMHSLLHMAHMFNLHTYLIYRCQMTKLLTINPEQIKTSAMQVIQFQVVH